MKKFLLLLLTLSICISACACGNDAQSDSSQIEVSSDTVSETSSDVVSQTSDETISDESESEPIENYYKIGDTVSTDIAKFTLDEAVFAIALNNTTGDTYRTPKEYDPKKDAKNPYVAATGHTFAYFSYTLENLDRANLNISLENLVKVEYNNETYKKAKTGAVYYYQPHEYLDNMNIKTKEAFKWHSNYSSNTILDVGHKESYRSYIDVAENITDLTSAFKLTVSLPSSSGKKVSFTFINEKNDFLKNSIAVESLVSVNGEYLNFKYSEHEINEKGQVIKVKVTGSDKYTATYEYDAQNRLVKENRKYATKDTVWEYKYDEKGNLISEFQGDRLFENTYTYTFDEKGRVLTKTMKNVTSDSGYTMVYIYTYNDDGTVKTETQKDHNSTYVITFTYDDKGRVIKEVSKKEGETSSSTTTYKYDVVARYIPAE